MRPQRQRRRSAQGFTLVESLVVLALMGILMTFGLPELLKTLRRERLVGSAREASMVLRQARSEAVKRNTRVYVTVDYTGGRVIAYRDLADPPDGFDEGVDPLVNAFVLPTGIGLFGPGDDIDGNVHVNASDGFPENAAGEGTVTFDGRGAASDNGAFRFSDTGGVDYLEVRIETAATGRIALQKYAGGEANEPASWKEQGEGSYVWEFGEIRAGEGG